MDTPPFRDEYWVVRAQLMPTTHDTEEEALERFEKIIEDPHQSLVTVEHVQVIRRHWM